MSEIEQDDIVHKCNFCSATNDDEITENLVMGPDGSLICNACIAHCEAILLESKLNDKDFKLLSANEPPATSERLRPITRIPKSWVICDTHLLKTIPSVIACSQDGQKKEEFSIPKQLAHWMIAYNDQKDIDKIREEIKSDLIVEMTRTLLLY